MISFLNVCYSCHGLVSHLLLNQNKIVSRRGSREKFVEGMIIWIDLFETIQQ